VNKSISVMGQLYGHIYAMVQCHECRWHHQIQFVQGYTGSHWMLPLGNNMFQIALAAARVPCKTQRQKNTTSSAGHSDGHGDAPVSYHLHQPMEEVPASIEFTGQCHWVSICTNKSNRTCQCWFSSFFMVHSEKKGVR
jgi:hypothetical protein